ncbi:hypothetical protein [Streptomyces sp. NRRL F-5630]|uniref:hypothetical protein n=1 Tax=Streptomyces sp. NRRL F-5630 TaxID=1463864 RepID=UPI00131B04CE|nr:hypothetical protein [Streptomyces sp. NRRL F-5630]
MATTPLLNMAGPAQSDHLIHFAGRPVGRQPTPSVPAEIRVMLPQQRLDSILASARVRAFAPFGAEQPAVCFSESPPEHLVHLIADRGFPPWGIVVSRSQVVATGGGAVAYLPDHVRDTFPPHLRHWAVPFGTDGRLGDWSHEREWRLPTPKGRRPADNSSAIVFRDETVLQAVLIGEPDWRPSPVGTGQWVDTTTGLPHPGPTNAFCQELTALPRLWRQAQEIWVWSPAARRIEKYAPDDLA